MDQRPCTATVAVREWMDVIESMVSGGHCNYPAGLSDPIKSVPVREVAHEFLNMLARRRDVPPDCDIVLRP